MSFSLLNLLLHEEDLPTSALDALRRATSAPTADRPRHLHAAAQALYQDAQLDCDDARELVGLYDALPAR